MGWQPCDVSPIDLFFLVGWSFRALKIDNLRYFKWIGKVSNFKRRIQSLQLCRERVKHFHFRPIYGTQVEVFFSLPAFRQRQMGPAAQEQSQRPAQLLAALKYPGWVLF